MTNAVTLDKGLGLKVTIAPPPKSQTLQELGPPEDINLYVDITPMVTGFKYYESITQYFVQSELELLDSTNQLENIFERFSDNCGIRKYCVVQVSFPDPLTNLSDQEAVIPAPRERSSINFVGGLTFYISKVENALIENTKKYYKIFLFEKSAIVNAHKTVTAAYPGNFSEIVQRVVREELYSDLPVNIDPQERPTPVRKYLAQKIKITDIIEYACQKSQLISEEPIQKNSRSTENTARTFNNTEIENKSTGFTFFQTCDGFYFKPLYKLVNPSNDDIRQKLKFFYEYKPLNSTDDVESAAYKVYSQQINEPELTSSALESAQAGTTGSIIVNNYDPFFGSFVSYFNKSAPYKSPCDTYNFEKDATPVINNTVTLTFDTNFLNSCNQVEPIKSPALKKSYDAILEYIRNNSVTAMVPGNLSLSAGNYISILTAGSEAESSDPNARLKVDIYMIYSLCHRVSGINKVFTDLVLYKVKKDFVVA